eukprot:TRINITY_DN123504_c0_g1_i1.p1 TRINITY_DN123504_c0_g1~~TRINITY_DN123504_c0_g1_i1.p1  ORF type:complete len:175 (-),score=9.93 TRINITY_DN123504_c0_g1_i1:263-787(-)
MSTIELGHVGDSLDLLKRADNDEKVSAKINRMGRCVVIWYSGFLFMNLALVFIDLQRSNISFLRFARLFSLLGGVQTVLLVLVLLKLRRMQTMIGSDIVCGVPFLAACMIFLGVQGLVMEIYRDLPSLVDALPAGNYIKLVGPTIQILNSLLQLAVGVLWCRRAGGTAPGYAQV